MRSYDYFPSLLAIALLTSHATAKACEPPETKGRNSIVIPMTTRAFLFGLLRGRLPVVLSRLLPVVLTIIVFILAISRLLIVVVLIIIHPFTIIVPIIIVVIVVATTLIVATTSPQT